MQIIVVKDKAAGGKAALKVFAAAKARGVKVFGLATGGTPETTYAELVASDLDFTDSISINLDEYVGLAADHPQSYAYYMHHTSFLPSPLRLRTCPTAWPPIRRRSVPATTKF